MSRPRPNRPRRPVHPVRPMRASTKSTTVRDGIWIVVVLAAFVAVGVGFYRTYQSKVRVDPITGCDQNGSTVVTAVLIDRSDAFSPLQALDLQQRLPALVGTLPAYARLDLYVLEAGAPELIEPKTSVCVPPRGKDVSQLVDNQRAAEQRWQTAMADLNAVFDEVLTSASADRSPLLETLKVISIRSFGPNEPITQRRQLLIVSDMLQHSEDYSLYRAGADPAAYLASPAGRTLSLGLRDVEVTLLLLKRERTVARQGSEMVRFWQTVIGAGGGQISSVVTIGE